MKGDSREVMQNKFLGCCVFLFNIFPSTDHHLCFSFFLFVWFFLIFYFYFILFIDLFWLRWVLVAARAFSSCGEQGLLFAAVSGIVVASLVAEHGLSSCGV